MDVAIVGMGCRFPGGADSPAAYWRLLRDGVDAVSEVPADRYDLDDLFDADPSAPGKVYTRWGGFLEAVDGFDAAFFGIAPREARRMDPQQRLLLEVVWEALEDGGQPPDRLASTSAGVFVGISTREYTDVQLLPLHPQRIDGHVNAGTAFSIAANRVSYLLDLRGPSFAVDTACSSSLTAVHLAARSLASAECDVAIAGGVGVLLAPEVTVGFCKASMLSPTGRCRAFDAASDGYVRAEGAGAVVLKPLERALADGDPIQAVILGSAINQDGRTTGLSLPSASAQQAMLSDALQDAGIAAADIGYVEAHGTGTPAGDPIEAEAIGGVLADGRPPEQPCLVGSAKTNLGHLEAAAGMAGLIKATLALQHRQVPPSLHFNEPNPDIDFAGLRLRVPTALEPWPPGHQRALAGVNSFGFGGANAHVVIAEPPAPLAVAESPAASESPVASESPAASESAAPSGLPAASESPAPSEPVAGRDANSREVHVVPLSARSPEALAASARQHLSRLDEDPPPGLHDLAYTAAVRRSHHPDRLALIARNTGELRERLQAFLEGEQRAGWVTGRAHPAREPRLAFVCTGMGPQWWGMARSLLATEPAFLDAVEQVDRLLEPLADWSLLAELHADEQASRVADADLAHVANLAVQVGLAAVWRTWGIVPDAVVGHSSGEMAAAVLSGALTLPDAVELAFHRGRLQHRTTGTGRMLAAGITPEEARQAVARIEDQVSLAAVNGPESVTLSGAADALARIADTLERAGRFARLLAVEVPYHSPQMETIRAEFHAAAAKVSPRAPDVPLASIVTGSWVDRVDLDADYWWRNVRDTVQFATATDLLVESGCEVFVEVGPHPVLAPAIAAVAAEWGVTATVLPSLRRDEDDSGVMASTLAALHVRGRSVDWDAVYPSGTCIRLPTYPWQRDRYWFDDEEEHTHEPARLAGVDTGHALLGRRLPSAQPTWETRLDTPEIAYLDDHVVQDTALFPGAGYLEMALAAARDLWGDTPALLEDVRFRKLMFLEPAGGAVQTVHQPRDGALDIYSEPPDGETDWTGHTSARLSRQAAGAQAPLDLADLRTRCDTPLSVEEHYRILESRGYGFGPAFRTLRDIRLGPTDDALARVGFPDGVELPVGGYRVHPALLDAAIQLFGAVSALTADLRADAPFFPVSIRRLAYRRPPGAQFWAYLVVHHGDEALIEGDAWLLDDDGAVAVSLEGLRLQVLDDQRPAAAPDVDDWLYELRWEPAEQGPGRRSALPPAAVVREAAEARAAAPACAEGVARYLDPVEPVLNRAAAGFTAAALAELGWESTRPGPDQPEDVAAALGVAPAHRRLFATLCERAHIRDATLSDRARNGVAEAGAATQEPDHGRAHDLEGPLPVEHQHELLDGLVASAPDYATEAELLRRGGARLADVLRGDIDARELLLSGDALELLARFYTDSPPCRAYHDLLAEAVASAVAERDAEAPLRVLELGAGTGAATAAVLPRLPEGTEYVFTDISPHFLAEAQRRFGDTAAVRCALLDVEQDPATQGFDAGTFDLVIAANVLHVTADLDRTLPHVRALLADGGLLALLELTRESAWLDLVFGLLDGWWRFTDRHRRPTGPMLTPDEWCALLSAHRFTDAGVLHRDAGADDAPLSVLLAQSTGRPTAAARPDRTPRHWVLFADGQGAGAGLGTLLEERGDTCTLVRPGEAYREEGDGSVTLPPGDASAYRSLLDDAPVGDGPLGLVHLWSLDIPSDADADGVMDGQDLGCGSVLSLVQALDGARGRADELWLVSSGAQPVPGLDAAPHLAQSPLWGLGRVLISEDADVRCRLVDLAPRPDEDLEALVDVIERSDEDEQALRGGQRFVRRLRHTTLAEHARPRQVRPRSPDTSAFRLEIDAPGSLERLVLRESPPVEPGPGEVAVRVRASGVNFRDVLQALGMLPAAAYQYGPDPEGLGIECAGVVVACGQGVTRFEPGDEVMALTAAAHAGKVIAREELTVPKPPGLSFAQAASVMNAFATVEHALRRVGRLAAEERVLIHSATGAVGLAAIQLCRRVGAEVFATAGNPDKRAYLWELGVEHVMDSRSLAFADEVLRATDGEGVDVVLNSLTGEALTRSLEVLAPHGRFLELGKRDILADAQLGLLPFQRNLSFHAIDLIGLGLERPAEATALIDDVAAELADGVLTAVPTTEFDLADADEAFRLMAKAQHIGKVVLTVEEPQYPVHARDDAPLFDPEGTYLITGGMGGFGLAVADWMGREGAGSIALLSRSGVPKQDAAGLERLRASPAEVTVLTGDVSREEDVASALERIRQELPPLRGVLHAAMVLDDDSVVRLDQQRFRSVLAPKVAGAWNLHRLTAQDDLDTFVLFSSVAAVIGHPLQGNYAAANAFLDALAAHRREQGLPALTVGWGAVTDVGYVSRHSDLARYLERGGFRGLSPEQATDTLGALLRADFDHVIAAPMDWRQWAELNSLAGASRRFRDFVATGDAAVTAAEGNVADAPLNRIQAASADDRRPLLVAHIQGKAAGVLGAAVDKVDPDRPLTQLGFDSLMAVELTTTFTSDFGVRVPVVEVLQHASCADLADRLLAALSLEATGTSSAASPTAAASEGAAPEASAEVGVEPSEAADARRVASDAAEVGVGPAESAEVGGVVSDAAEVGVGPTEAAEQAAPTAAGGALSFEQQRFWYLERSQPGDPTYNQPIAARLRGALDPGVLRDALTELLRRHPVLRTAVYEADGVPTPQLRPPTPAHLPIEDLRHLAADDRDRELARRASAASRVPVDLARPPLLRATLYRVDEEDHLLLLVVHHIACDHVAVGVIVHELAALYEAFADGRPSPLSEPDASYDDYIQAQRERVAAVGDAQLDYWRHQLAGAPTGSLLPWQPPSRRSGPAQGRYRRFELGTTTTAALRELAKREGVTVFMTLLAALQALLHRYSGSDDVLVGTAVSTRPPEAAAVVGCFLNTLVLRGDLSGDPTFRELLARVKQTTLEAFEHQDVPFERVVEALRPQRAGGRSPLFETLLVLHSAQLPQPRVAGLDIDMERVDNGGAVADLSLLLDTGERVSGLLEYDTARLDAATVERLLSHFTRLLDAAVAEPETALSALPLSPPAERWEVTSGWNDTAADLGPSACLHQLVEEQADRTPDAVAVAAPGEHLTYAELDVRANRLARYLQGLGVHAGEPVGVSLPRSSDLVVAALASLKAGGVYVPLDPDLPPARLQELASDTLPAAVVTHTALSALFSGHGAVIALDHARDAIAACAAERVPRNVTPDDLAYMVYTSGSSGRPKGVLVEHRAIVNDVRWRQHAFPLSIEDAVLLRTPIGFDPAVWEVLGALSTGARLVVPPAEAELDTGRLVRLIAEEAVTLVQVVPSVLDVLLDEPDIGACGALRRVLCGGEPLPPALARRCLALLPAELHNLYGPAEAAIDTTHWACRPDDDRSFVPIGRPIANARVLVLDERGEPAPVGIVGELHIGGAGLARGYHGHSELNAERFVADPTAPDQLLYRTGDLGRWLPDGSLALIGRADRQLKVRGVRVEPGEVEAVLGRVPGVREAAVVARNGGHGGAELVAFVTTDGRQVAAEHVRGHAADHLPTAMVPAEAIVVGSLPRGSHGKTDYEALREWVPAREPVGRAGPKVAPRDQLERALADIWADLLPGREVGVTEDFFASGGHSLLAMRLLARIEQAFGRRLPASSLLELRTIAGIAELLRDEEPPASALVALQPHGRRPPFVLPHATAGTVYCYRALAEALGGARRPVYGLEAPSIEREPPRSIEDLAGRYVDELTRAEPHEPYLLAGWSMGGLIAYEMARRLEASGRPVALVALLDSAPVGPLDGDRVEEESLRHLMADLGLQPDGLAFDEAGSAGERTDDRLNRLLDHARRVGALPADMGLPGFQRLLDTAVAHLEAVRRYVPGPYGGVVTLLDAEESLGREQAHVRRWHELAGSVVRHVVPGDHSRMLQPPDAAALAERLVAAARVSADASTAAPLTRPS